MHVLRYFARICRGAGQLSQYSDRAMGGRTEEYFRFATGQDVTSPHRAGRILGHITGTGRSYQGLGRAADFA